MNKTIAGQSPVETKHESPQGEGRRAVGPVIPCPPSDVQRELFSPYEREILLGEIELVALMLDRTFPSLPIIERGVVIELGHSLSRLRQRLLKQPTAA